MYIYKLYNAAASKPVITNTATTLYDLIDTAGGASSNLSGNLNACDLILEDGDARMLFDDTPTATNGVLLSSGVMYNFRGVPLSKMKLIRVSGNVTCSVQVGMSELGENSNACATAVTLEAADIEIGAVELKNASSDERASIEAANTARTTATKVLATQHIGANGSPQPSGVASDPIYVKDTSTGTDILIVTDTGSGALNKTTAIAAEWKLIGVMLHFNTAPVTSQNVIVKLDSVTGAAYDTNLYVLDPSLSAATDIVYIPDGELKFKSGDELVVTYTNTDTRTYGLTIYYQLI
jgi:hypothetical protein